MSRHPVTRTIGGGSISLTTRLQRTAQARPAAAWRPTGRPAGLASSTGAGIGFGAGFMHGRAIVLVRRIAGAPRNFLRRDGLGQLRHETAEFADLVLDRPGHRQRLVDGGIRVLLERCDAAGPVRRPDAQDRRCRATDRRSGSSGRSGSARGSQRCCRSQARSARPAIPRPLPRRSMQRRGKAPRRTRPQSAPCRSQRTAHSGGSLHAPAAARAADAKAPKADSPRHPHSRRPRTGAQAVRRFD